MGNKNLIPHVKTLLPASYLSLSQTQPKNQQQFPCNELPQSDLAAHLSLQRVQKFHPTRKRPNVPGKKMEELHPPENERVPLKRTMFKRKSI